MNIYHQARELVGRVYIHPVSKDIVVLTEGRDYEELVWCRYRVIKEDVSLQAQC